MTLRQVQTLLLLLTIRTMFAAQPKLYVQVLLVLLATKRKPVHQPLVVMLYRPQTLLARPSAVSLTTQNVLTSQTLSLVLGEATMMLQSLLALPLTIPTRTPIAVPAPWRIVSQDLVMQATCSTRIYTCTVATLHPPWQQIVTQTAARLTTENAQA
jgi:hypothetical protein